MRIAFVLNGLTRDLEFLADDLIDLTNILKKKYNIDSDFYCHFWSNQGVYFYDNNPFEGTIATQNPKGVEKILKSLDPVLHKISKPIDMEPEFLKYYHHVKSTNYELFNSLSTKQRAGHRHSKWRMFCNKFSQLYGFESVMSLVKQSKISYDAVIRFRYDVLYDSEKNTDMLVKAIKTQTDNLIIQDMRKYSSTNKYSEQDMIYSVSSDTFDSNFEYGMGDVMFLSSLDNMINYSEDLYKKSTEYLLKIDESFHFVYPTEIFWLSAALSKNIPVTINIRLYNAIIRHKDELSKNYKQNINATVDSLSHFRYPIDTFEGSK